MAKKIAATILALSILISASGCVFDQKKIARFLPNKIARAQTLDSSAQQAETFNLSLDKPEITFTKSAIASSKETAYVIPQTSGKISKINVKLGDKVQKGTTLITLGDSLATDIAAIQYQTAIDALNLAKDSQLFTSDSSRQTIQTAALAVKTAYEDLQNAKNAKENAEDVYEEQKTAAKLGKDGAKDSKNFATSSLDKLDSTIASLKEKKSTLEETLSKMDSSDPDYEKLSTALEKLTEGLVTAEAQRDTVTYSKENAARGIDQAENGLDLLEESFNAQLDQMDFAITAATNQYEMAQKQFQLTLNGTSLQKIGTDSQILQLSSASQIASLSNDQKLIKSPISGYVTDISAEENNMVSPGMSVAKVEDPTTLSIKVNLNSDEASLVTVGQKVEITFGTKTLEGSIKEVSPSLSDTSKKISVKIEAENKNSAIIPGALVKVTFSSAQKNRIFIPLNSLHNSDDKQLVTVVIDKKAKFQEVKIGEIVGEYVEVISGLTGTETILKTSDNFIKEGDQIN
jgi:RND family efflux transporter MFP subunit